MLQIDVATKHGMKMENIVIDETARVNATDVLSEFEHFIDRELKAWAELNVDKEPGLKYHDSQYSINKFWNERLN